MHVTSILVNTDLIRSSYVNGIPAYAIHSFSPSVGPGHKIREKPQPELIFCSVNSSEIDSIRIWLTDEENNPIDLQGEEITVRFLIREVANRKRDIRSAVIELKNEKYL
jgi:hypothetical protein